MSALARYFHTKGHVVAGYDRTSTPLTQALENEGIRITFCEKTEAIPAEFLQKNCTTVIYTPAIPAEHPQLCYFQSEGFEVKKRSMILGDITRSSHGLCVAGTHGKTTTSTILAHLMHQSVIDCNAFLGGISQNYNTNLLLSAKSDYVVVEADEYDRSFHRLNPYMAIITTADPDHLDIYGNEKGFREGFEHFTSLIAAGGALVMHKNVNLTPRLQNETKLYSYSENEGDFHAENIRIANGEIIFDFVTPDTTIRGLQLGVPVKINIENSVAAMAVAWLCGVTEEELRQGIATYQGIHRRFNILVKNEKNILIDDYAHHPTELHASISSIKALYPDKKITGVFQPHLFTRTRDFMKGFARELSQLDKVILLPIYPARELPIEGVNSEALLALIENKNKILCPKENLVTLLAAQENEVIVTLGAGNIDAEVPRIKEMLLNK